ncbi:DUF6258 family protein [Escherichia coli]|uniref:DUF6258 family protein n=1 Tax=Escherichia coli TaxID=562 RepID=UPI002034A3EB|nr:DUF6258 family protein [Escherichia coli]
MFDRIYLGDRAIKKIEFDLWSKQIRIQVNLISRIAYGTTEWIFYDNEDLEDGYLVFSDVSFFNITPNGSIPDDYIISIITDNVNVEYFESTIVAVGQIQIQILETLIILVSVKFSSGINTAGLRINSKKIIE